MSNSSRDQPCADAQERSPLTHREPKFADHWWSFLHQKARWEDGFDALLTGGEDYDRLGTDDYDASLEIYGAANDWRLSTQQQSYLRDGGFYKIFVNHKDGAQTHYTFGNDVNLPVRGWRRRYVSDETASTTNVIAGRPNPGYYEISFWPEGWTSDRCKDWITTGYMRVVPDPLDPLSNGAGQGPCVQLGNSGTNNPTPKANPL